MAADTETKSEDVVESTPGVEVMVDAREPASLGPAADGKTCKARCF